jgi:hypothetical protein
VQDTFLPRARQRIILSVARGWESKSIEAQQDEAASKTSSTAARLTPAEAARSREIEGLRLSLQRAIQQLERTTDSRRRAPLEQAVSDLERKILTLKSEA